MHPSRLLLPSTLLACLVAACSSTVPPSVERAPSSTPAATVAATTVAPSSVVPSPSADTSAPPSAEPTVAPTPDPTPDPTPAPTQIAGCGTGSVGFSAHSGEFPKTWTFGAATIEFASAGIAMRDGSVQSDDAIPAGIGLTRDELAVRVDPGTHILLRARGVTLTRLDVGVVPWASVVFSSGGDLGSSAATPETLDWRLRPDGSISVSAPDVSGDYMVAFHPLWQSACLEGDGSAYGRIKVN